MDPLWIFAIYYSSVVSMQYHPGAGTREHKKLTLEECAEVARRMVEITYRQYPRPRDIDGRTGEPV